MLQKYDYDHLENSHQKNIKITNQYVFGFVGSFLPNGNFGGSFGVFVGYSVQDLILLTYIFLLKGRAYSPLRGLIQNKDILLDGKILQDATIKNCNVRLENGDFAHIGDCSFSGCTFDYRGYAMNLLEVFNGIINS